MPAEQQTTHPDDMRWGVSADGRPLCAKPRLRWYWALLLGVAVSLAVFTVFEVLGINAKCFDCGMFMGPFTGMVAASLLQAIAYQNHNARIVKRAIGAQLRLCLRCGLDLRDAEKRCPACGQEIDREVLEHLWRAWIRNAKVEHSYMGSLDDELRSQQRRWCIRCGAVRPSPGDACPACKVERR